MSISCKTIQKPRGYCQRNLRNPHPGGYGNMSGVPILRLPPNWIYATHDAADVCNLNGCRYWIISFISPLPIMKAVPPLSLQLLQLQKELCSRPQLIPSQRRSCLCPTCSDQHWSELEYLLPQPLNLSLRNVTWLHNNNITVIPYSFYRPHSHY